MLVYLEIRQGFRAPVAELNRVSKRRVGWGSKVTSPACPEGASCRSYCGTIWIPFTAARLKPLVAVLGIADKVKPETFGIVRIR